MLAGFAALALAGGFAGLPSWVGRMVLALGLGAAALAVTLVAARHVPGTVSQASRGFLRAARQALLSGGLWWRQGGLSLIIVGCNLATVAFCARATGTDLGLIATLTIVPLMLLAMLLPVAAGGWGLREAAAAALWPLVGAAAAAGVAASIAFGLVILAASLPGIVTLARPGPAAPG
jgi:uncharacterized membrane protein YbhN (UPF0104 family)